MKLSLIRPKYLKNSLIQLAIASFTFFLVLEYSLYKFVGSLSEDIPRLYGTYALRSAILIFFSAASVLFIHKGAVKKQKYGQELALANQPWTSARKIMPLGILLINSWIVSLLFLDPILFSGLAREDVLIEPLSALFFFVGSTVLLRQAYKLYSQKISYQLLTMGILCCLVIVYFVIAMEEVSWFQRVVEFETPDAFTTNLQGEFNLHNFATKIFENAFYTGGFLWLIGLPFLKLTSSFPLRLKILERFVAGTLTLCLSCVFVAYNYHYWNGFLTQIPYFLTFFALISLGVLSQALPRINIYWILALALLGIQAAFLAWGDTMPRLWDATEYKEFFLALGFLVYTFDIRDNFPTSTNSL